MMAKHLAPALACAAALSTLPAAAGPSQGGVNPPGGFVSACASDLSPGSGFTPGGDMLAVFSSHPQSASCQGQYFAGTAGSTAAASYATSTMHSQSSVGATMGKIGFGASTTAPSMSFFAVGVGGGGWSDTVVVDLAGHSGEQAIWRYTMHVGGTMSSAGYAGATVLLNGYKNEVELLNSVAGFDRGDSDAFTTDRQRVAWSVHYNVGRTVDDVVTFAVPVTLGQSFVWGVYATGNASVGYAGIGGNSTSELDFGDGLHYGGSAGLYIGGVAMDGYTLQSASGVDWMQAAAVPEPGTWALWSAGLMIGVMRLRRQPRSTSAATA